MYRTGVLKNISKISIKTGNNGKNSINKHKPLKSAESPEIVKLCGISNIQQMLTIVRPNDDV